MHEYYLMLSSRAQAGIRLIQILPVNDTSVTNTWWDSYPYSSLSVFALHPIYINLDDLKPSNAIKEEIVKQRQVLNKGHLMYEVRIGRTSPLLLQTSHSSQEVMAVKMQLLHQIWNEQKASFLASSGTFSTTGTKDEKFLYIVFVLSWCDLMCD
jgi:4-alpha-glucanotransferase